MGRPMALHLMKHGHAMGVYARRAESAAPLVAAGATRYDTPAALAAQCEVIFTMVTSSQDVTVTRASWRVSCVRRTCLS